MTRPVVICCMLLAAAGISLAEPEPEFVFRSDVSLARVDAQVLDRGNKAITGLRVEDFVLRENGEIREIRNFASEEMPVDFLLLLDVSGSMRPHVERVAAAAHEAFRVLGDNDRVALMVFDRGTRVRLPFRQNLEEVEMAFERLLDQEDFNGGTDVTRGLLDAAEYMNREGRRDARRAIVILTDDQTERDRNEAAVIRALSNANTVLSSMITPDAMGTGRPRVNTMPWPGGSLGGIIFGRRDPFGGNRVPTVQRSRTRSAGTAEISRRSGGDSMRVEEAAAFETVLSRIRQRYALHFYVADDSKTGSPVEVELSDAARRRYPGADVRFQRHNLTSGSQPAVSAAAAPSVSRPSAAPAAPEQPSRGGWRRVRPGEQP